MFFRSDGLPARVIDLARCEMDSRRSDTASASLTADGILSGGLQGVWVYWLVAPKQGGDVG